MFTHEKRRYLLTGITPILGTQAASAAVRTQYIASKAPSDDLRAEESEEYGPDMEDRGHTVFHRDIRNKDRIVLLDYQIKGFFKSALAAGRADLGICQEASKADKFLFIGPRRVPITKDGKEILDEDDVYERPLRAKTPLGERIALVSSEMIEDPWQLDFEVTLFANDGSKKSKPVTWDAIEGALDYGMYMGLMQFRTGGFGRFTWERVDCK